jgi:hypothetical protein
MIGYLESHHCSSFTGLSVRQFDDVYREIEPKYQKYEIKRLSYKRNRERDIGTGR